jgi:hypothetical protein
MVLKVCYRRELWDEEESSILEREEKIVAFGAKRHFPWHYSRHTASHNRVLERRHHAAEGHYKEHSPSAVKKVGPCSVVALAFLRYR